MICAAEIRTSAVIPVSDAGWLTCHSLCTLFTVQCAITRDCENVPLGSSTSQLTTLRRFRARPWQSSLTMSCVPTSCSKFCNGSGLCGRTPRDTMAQGHFVCKRPLRQNSSRWQLLWRSLWLLGNTPSLLQRRSVASVAVSAVGPDSQGETVVLTTSNATCQRMAACPGWMLEAHSTREACGSVSVLWKRFGEFICPTDGVPRTERANNQLTHTKECLGNHGTFRRRPGLWPVWKPTAPLPAEFNRMADM